MKIISLQLDVSRSSADLAQKLAGSTNLIKAHYKPLEKELKPPSIIFLDSFHKLSPRQTLSTQPGKQPLLFFYFSFFNLKVSIGGSVP